jgi:hypothetical protein
MGHLPLIFLEWRNLPPGRSIPQAPEIKTAGNVAAS